MRTRIPQSEIPPLLERYELKYLIPEFLIDPISEYLSVYCSPDEYSQESPDGFYTIHSLYLDSPNFLFLKRRIQGAGDRFNMRIRSYCPKEHLCFFEIKHKTGGIIRKFRAPVSDKNWRRLFETPGYDLEHVLDEKNKSNVCLFYKTACTYQVEPKVLTRYRRKAYVSDVDDYARVTFDRELCCQEADGYNLIPDENRMIGYDSEAIFDPECSVILELKCNASQAPLWMLDIIRYFELHRRRFSKYLASAVQTLGLNAGYGCFERVPSWNYEVRK